MLLPKCELRVTLRSVRFLSYSKDPRLLQWCQKWDSAHMAGGTRTSVRLDEQLTILMERMEEQSRQLQRLTEQLSGRIESTEKEQHHIATTLREIESSLLRKQKEMCESILQESVTGDRTPEKVSHDPGADMPSQDMKVTRGSSIAVVTQKAIPFDGKVCWDAYKTQFEMLASMNHWDEQEKALHLATSLRGSAMGVLSQLPPEKRQDYAALCTALELRFGAAHQVELNRMRLRTRRRHREESLPELAEDVERLTRLAYPEADNSMAEILAKDQFIDALPDEEMRLKVRQSHPSTLQHALETSLELESFELASRLRPRMVREATLEEPEPDDKEPEPDAISQLVELVKRALRDPDSSQKSGRKDQSRRRTMVCWTCGQRGHIQRECPQRLPARNPSQTASHSGNGQ